MIHSMTRRAVLGAALAMPALRSGSAEVAEVVIAKQFGTLYLQQEVMEQQRLVEKHAARLGLPGLKASYIRLAGSGPVTDGILSGKLHFASGGAPAAMLLWDRTRGGVKSAFAMNANNQRLVTVNPKLTAVKDLAPDDRIALPAVKTAPQALWLQMAAVAGLGQIRMGALRSAHHLPRPSRQHGADAGPDRGHMPLVHHPLPGARAGQPGRA